MSTQVGTIPTRPQGGMALTVGGALTLGSGLFSILNGLQGIVFDGWFAFGPDVGFSRFALCGVICILFGIIAVAGGISALRRTRFSLALAGGVFGMLGGGLIGFWMGLAALVLFAFSNEDF